MKFNTEKHTQMRHCDGVECFYVKLSQICFKTFFIVKTVSQGVS
jgi:hypothetical protein